MYGGGMTAYMDHKDLANTSISSEREQEIHDNTLRVLDRVAQAEAHAGREPGSVQLLAATKTRDVGEIMAAVKAGVRLLGENRPQEILAKIEGLQQCCAQEGMTVGLHDGSVEHTDGDFTHIPLHLIGQLQANKISKILPDTDVIESVDSIDLAQKIARRAVAHHYNTGIMLEVNESGEPSKSGCSPDEAFDIACEIAGIEGLHLCGLMTIGAHVDSEPEIRRCFTALRELRERVLASGVEGTADCTELSMGMSGDMEIAIEEGATQVRLGRAIFGERLFV